MSSGPGPTSEPTAGPGPGAARRYVLFALGLLFTAVGIVGAFLPLIPTTPFLILALWAFSGSSERLHGWLLRHRRFGPPLQRWRTHRVVSWRAKITAWSMMAASLAYTIFVRRAPWPLVAAIAALMAIAVWYVATKPSRVPADAAADPDADAGADHTT
ncbi:MAG TPA: YbaN family protein [Kofleriaceae bacterium]|nr:YbaN family protein [Kofleriaceae bacterium]